MASSAPDRRRVYITCRPIFTGDNALLRREKKIRNLVRKNKLSLTKLLSELGEDKLVAVLKGLLEENVFVSEVCARAIFPDLFQTTPSRNAEREVSEAKAAKSAAKAVEEVVASEDNLKELSDEEPEPGVLQFASASAPFPVPTLELTTTGGPDELLKDQIPSLYPSFIPYKAQHLILTAAQQLLEECCFDFAAKWMPSLLEQRGWDCAAAVELTKWTQILGKTHTTLPPNAIKLANTNTTTSPPMTIRDLVQPAQTLRHTAVHRLPTTARGIGRLLGGAVALADALQDHGRAAQLEQLKAEVDAKVRAMELSKNSLEDRAARVLRDIARRREELDRAERDLKATMLREDADNKALVGRLLEESVRSIIAAASDDGARSRPADRASATASGGSSDRGRDDSCDDATAVALAHAGDREVYYSGDEGDDGDDDIRDVKLAEGGVDVRLLNLFVGV
ncbi:hypothetical protein B0T24DRAFT_693343 [Lasiosphaeria ovina]|uniref:Ubiquinol-cytochrome-c reductase cytochrome c1 n=1 Tax=Lasiosphaeria ovina TaxID=92902 RepID=A0AAE0MY03_9PEZI|nr:hypothetical protein B0T24DRAFT_693343 [Lasiosphaeria ovina]